ncbi:MAG: hypothetical protein ABWX68_00295 [Arthrobacter sp.]|uniref:hypothetical protein n=1 Tax=Arthrobacter sp. TaxID=1667 RepID=UPI0034927AD4
MVVLALVLVVLAAVGGLPQYFRRFRGRSHRLLYATAGTQLTLLGAAAILAAAAGASGDPAAVAAPVAAAFTVAAAALGGGPVTLAILRLSHREDVAEERERDAAAAGEGRTPAREDATAEGPGQPVLRGGAWIGALERTAIAATLWAGWPEGLAVVLAVKGLGRYSELGQDGAAERFILGTFASVLWACACAGIGFLLRA